MTDKKTPEELNSDDLDKAQGGWVDKCSPLARAEQKKGKVAPDGSKQLLGDDLGILRGD